MKKVNKRKEAKAAMKAEQHKQLLEKFSNSISIANPAMDYPEARKLHRHFIFHVGGTNSGKTFESIEALKASNSGIYLAPLRLLAIEVANKLNKANCKCNLLTGEEEEIVPGAKHISATVEKADIKKLFDVAVIDECQMIADPARGGAWTRAIMGIQAKTIYLCMTPEAVQIIIDIINLCGDDYEIVEHKRNTPLIVEDDYICYNQIIPGDAVIAFSRKNVLNIAAELEDAGYSVAKIYGSLPYQVRKEEAEKFRNGEYDVVVATDAIGVGLNLPIHRIVFSTIEKYDGEDYRLLTTEEVKQIAGRAGRYGMYSEGYVTVLETDNWYESASANLNYIRKQLNKPINSISTAMLSFPEKLLETSNEKVSDSIKAWLEISYSEKFAHADYSAIINRAKYIEKKYGYKVSKEDTYRLAIVPMSDDCVADWEEYIDKFVNRISNDSIINELCIDLDDDIYLWEKEREYRRHTLYFSFCKAIKMANFDKKKYEQIKIHIIKNIENETRRSA